jgi:hypothetical protein
MRMPNPWRKCEKCGGPQVWRELNNGDEIAICLGACNNFPSPLWTKQNQIDNEAAIARINKTPTVDA